MNIGHKHWTIAEGWISPLGDETVAFLNTSLQEAHVQIFIYYSNRDPVGPYHLICTCGANEPGSVRSPNGPGTNSACD